ncbi:zinc finger protein 425-like [Ptychodera flava]|uniref:zinc finger protein 425-like n=1 Tax=Ptychodera flava TaxID=63121 RepID=UPI00396A9F20
MMEESRQNEEYESSDEDVFECGRCKAKFTSMELFMDHKKSKICHRSKKTNDTKQEVKSASDVKHVPSPLSNLQKIAQVPASGSELLSHSDDVVMTQNEESGKASAGDSESLKDISNNVIENLLQNKAVVQSTAKDTFVQSLALQSPSSQVQADQQALKPHSSGQDSTESNSDLVDIIRQASIASGIEIADQFQDQHVSHTDQKVTAHPIECTFCYEKTSTIDELCSHYQDIHNISSRKAVMFAKEKQREITKSKLATRRARLVAREQPKAGSYHCRLCNMSFKTSAKLTKHRKTKKHLDRKEQQQATRSRKREYQSVGDDEEHSEDQGLLKCASCDYEASEMSDLRDHLTSHKKVKGKFHCTDCDLYFSTRTDLSDHTVAEHGKELRRSCTNRKVPCSDCGQLVQHRSLAKHKQLHSQSDADLTCPLCKHEASKTSDYEVHIDNHKVWVSAVSDSAPNSTSMAVTTDSNPIASIISQLQQAPNEDVIVTGNQSSTIDLSSLGLEHIRTMQAAESLAQMCPEAQNGIVANITDTQINQQLDTATELSNSQFNQASSNEAACSPTGAENNENANNTQAVGSEVKHTKGGQLKCKECDTFYARDELPKHMWAKHKMTKKFQCRDGTCKMTSDVLKEFSQHVVTNHANAMFSCSCRRCLKKGKVDPHHKAALKKEKMRVYYQQMGFKCMKCWVKFPSQAGLDRHLAKESHNYPCPECDKIHVSKRQLRIHMITHQTERQYLCEKCGQDFKTPRDLQRHSISHSNIKPFLCTDCGKGFGFRNKLHRHILTVHTAVKPYNCPEPGCNKAFARKDKLTDHQRTHLTYEPFKCEFCQRGFFRKDNLKDHLVLHTGEFRFRCDICSKGFMRPKLLEKHKKTDHCNEMQQQAEVATTTTTTAAIVEPGYQICTIDGQSFSLKEVNSQVQIQVKITP